MLYTSSGTFTANGLFTRRPVEFELPLGTIQSSGNRVTESQLADFNGDGLADFVTYTSVQVPGEGVQYQYQIYPMERTTVATAQQGMPYKFGTVRTWRPNVCGVFSFRGGPAKKPRFEPVDFNNDGFSDLRLTYENGHPCVAGNNSVVILPSNPAHPDLIQYRAQNATAVPKRDYFFISAGMTTTGAMFSMMSSPFSDLADGESRRVADINGDGVSDIVQVFAKAPKRVVYALGTGVGFAYDQLANTIYAPVSEDASFELADLNQDGALEVIYPYNPATVSTEKALSGSPQSCAPGEIREFRVLSWSGDTFVPGNSFAFGAPKFCDREYVRLFGDLDGDGNLDALYMGDEEAHDTRGEAILYRSATRFKPAHRVERLTDGLGAIQLIKYSPMTYSSLYQRDFSAPYFRSDFALGAAGRGSALFDVSSTSYLVQYTWTSAPTASDPVVDPNTLSGMTGIQYFYEGAKAQAGGRGALGFRAVNTLDLQTWIRSRTEYDQKFPLVSVPKSTTMWQLDTSVMASDPCNGFALGDTPGCMIPTPVCSDGVAGQCVRYPTGALISENIDAWSARPVQFSVQNISGGQYFTPSTVTAANAQAWQVRRATSNAKNYEFGTLTFSQTTAYNNYL